MIALRLALLLVATAAAAEAIVDDMGRRVEIALPVERLAVFGAGNAELVRAIGGAEAVAALEAGIRNPGYWPLFPEGPGIGPAAAPDYDGLAAVAPDVVIMPADGAWAEARDRLDMPVVVLSGSAFTQRVRLLGQLLGRQDRAGDLVAFYEQSMALLAERLAGVDRRTVLLDGLAPPLPGSPWYDLIVAGGGEPVGAAIADPEVIIRIACCTDRYWPPGPDELQAAVSTIVGRPGWSELQAVQSGDVHVVGHFAATAVGHMIGAVYVAKALHPQLFADLDPEALVRRWLEDFQGVPYVGAYGFSLLGNF